MTWWMWTAVALVAMLLIPPTRNLLGRITGSSIHWMTAEGGLLIGRTILWIIKQILVSHWTLLRNLTTPRSLMVAEKTGDDTSDYGG